MGEQYMRGVWSGLLACGVYYAVAWVLQAFAPIPTYFTFMIAVIAAVLVLAVCANRWERPYFPRADS